MDGRLFVKEALCHRDSCICSAISVVLFDVGMSTYFLNVCQSKENKQTIYTMYMLRQAVRYSVICRY